MNVNEFIIKLEQAAGWGDTLTVVVDTPGQKDTLNVSGVGINEDRNELHILTVKKELQKGEVDGGN